MLGGADGVDGVAVATTGIILGGADGAGVAKNRCEHRNNTDGAADAADATAGVPLSENTGRILMGQLKQQMQQMQQQELH